MLHVVLYDYLVHVLIKMAVHAVDMALVFNELLETFRQNFRYFLIECRARDTAKPGRLARLRYLQRQLLKPPDVPRTPSADLTLRLYRKYGHPYSHVVSGIEGHVVCWVIGVSRKHEVDQSSAHNKNAQTSVLIMIGFLSVLIQ
jgi:hypothetical protein